MRLTNGFDISSSALTTQRLRMDVISSNIANADSTRDKFVDGKWVPYQRKMVIVEPKNQTNFAEKLQNAMKSGTGQGVRVSNIVGDKTRFKRVYNPVHPDSNADGYVYMPNVDIQKEMVDMISATRSYEANVTALNATKGMITKALEIGR